jgi:Skp family chaperone for outer membrane proteins
MTKKKELPKAERINKEEARLRRTYKSLPKDVISIMDGLFRRAAYMRATLEDYEKDLDENGYVEKFTQSEKTEPYERERPAARLYNTMTKNYQSAIKQLDDKLPKEEVKEVDDGFNSFVNARDD